MLRIPPYLLAVPYLLSALAQSSSGGSRTTTLPPFIPPNGVQTVSNDLESVIPLICEVGCYVPLATYLDCYDQNVTLSGGPVNLTGCTDYFCEQASYDQMSQCLNCIIANGNDRPPGYHTNTSITAYPQTSTYALPNGFKQLNFPLIDMDMANQILANITSNCQSASLSVTGATTVTATPSTTGPYYTSWTSGQLLNVTQYTGLTQYTSGLDPITSGIVETLNAAGSPVSATGSASQTAVLGSAPASTGASASGSSPSSSTSTSASASASPTSGGERKYLNSVLCAGAVVLGASVVLL